MDLVDVGGVEGGGKGAEGEEVGVGWGDGVGVEAVAVEVQWMRWDRKREGERAYSRTSGMEPCLG